MSSDPAAPVRYTAEGFLQAYRVRVSSDRREAEQALDWLVTACGLERGAIDRGKVLETLRSSPDVPGDLREQPQPGDVWISTIHQAKGWGEFDFVVIANVGQLLSAADGDPEVSRLTYVAATRAPPRGGSVRRFLLAAESVWLVVGISDLPTTSSARIKVEQSWRQAQDELWRAFRGTGRMRIRYQGDELFVLEPETFGGVILTLSRAFTRDFLTHVRAMGVSSPFATEYSVRITELRTYATGNGTKSRSYYSRYCLARLKGSTESWRCSLSSRHAPTSSRSSDGPWSGLGLRTRQLIDPPSRTYLCGFLSPTNSNISEEQNDELQGGDNESSIEGIPSLINAMWPSAMGLTVHVKPGVERVRLTIQLGLYKSVVADEGGTILGPTSAKPLAGTRLGGLTRVARWPLVRDQASKRNRRRGGGKGTVDDRSFAGSGCTCPGAWKFLLQVPPPKCLNRDHSPPWRDPAAGLMVDIRRHDQGESAPKLLTLTLINANQVPDTEWELREQSTVFQPVLNVTAGDGCDPEAVRRTAHWGCPPHRP